MPVPCERNSIETYIYIKSELLSYNITMASSDDIVEVGNYVVIQRQDYTKLHKTSPHNTVQLGKDILDISSTLGKPFWTCYKMEQKKGGKRSYELKECQPVDQLWDTSKETTSGSDNRNIVDDGSSQKLSMEEIVSLRDEGLSSKEIVGTLIDNSKTFHSKTEYSQQKYLKKKEKKYFEYVTIRKPSIRLIAEIMYRQDPGKILGLRIDTLSQIMTAVNFHSHGTYILYESGCQALCSSLLLNGLSAEGKLLLVHTGNIPQKQALLAMNFKEEQMNSLISVNIYSLLRRLKSSTDETVEDTCKKDNTTTIVKVETDESSKSIDNSSVEDSASETIATAVPKQEVIENNEPVNPGKRKHIEDEGGSAKKKPRWEVETEKASDILKRGGVDGLVIVCREHPGSIVKTFLPYLAASRNFVIYCPMKEPLQELLLDLKQYTNVIYLRLTDTWLRNYQVLDNRTHPLVNMTSNGGYLLTGVVVEKTV